MSLSGIVIKRKGKKCETSLSSTTLTSNCYSDTSATSSCSSLSSCSTTNKKCKVKKKCSSSSSSSSRPSIEVIEISTSGSSSCSSSESSCSTKCEDSCYDDYCGNGCGNGCGKRCGKRRRNRIGRSFGDCYYYFYAVVQPLSNFKLLDGSSTTNGLRIEVSMNSKTTTLQWPGFSGNVTSSGIPYVSIGQFFKGLPSYDVFSSFLINYQSGDALSTVQIVSNNSDTIRWYLTASRKGTGVSSNSFISIYGGSITYVNSCDAC